jgi:hypothetical protein
MAAPLVGLFLEGNITGNKERLKCKKMYRELMQKTKGYLGSNLPV